MIIDAHVQFDCENEVSNFATYPDKKGADHNTELEIRLHILSFLSAFTNPITWYQRFLSKNNIEICDLAYRFLHNLELHTNKKMQMKNLKRISNTQIKSVNHAQFSNNLNISLENAFEDPSTSLHISPFNSKSEVFGVPTSNSN